MTNVGTTTIYHPNIDDRKTYNQKGAEADQKLLLLSQLEWKMHLGVKIFSKHWNKAKTEKDWKLPVIFED